MRYFIKTAGSEQTGYEVKGNKVYKVTYTSQPGMEMQEIREEVKDFQDKETIKRMLKTPDMVKFKKLSEYKMYYNEEAAEIFKGAKKKCKKKKGAMAKKATLQGATLSALKRLSISESMLKNIAEAEKLNPSVMVKSKKHYKKIKGLAESDLVAITRRAGYKA